MCADLTLAMQKLYQTFVALAAQLQSIHENVKVGSYLQRCLKRLPVKVNSIMSVIIQFMFRHS